MRPEDSEVVVYVGIAVHDGAFKGLPKTDQDHIRGMADVPAVPMRPIFRHGQVVGYGIPLIIADTTDEFHELDIAKLYNAAEQAKAKFRELVRRVAVPPEPKCYSPKLFHRKEEAVA